MGRTDLDGGAGGSGGSGGARVPFILHVYTDGIPMPRKRQHTACRQTTAGSGITPVFDRHAGRCPFTHPHPHPRPHRDRGAVC